MPHKCFPSFEMRLLTLQVLVLFLLWQLFMLCQQSLEHLFFSIYSPPNSRLFQVFTRMIKVPDVESQEIIHILWSSSSSDYDKPNHFVLCVDVNSKIFSSLTPISALCDSIVMPANNVKRKQTTLNFTQAKKS